VKAVEPTFLIALITMQYAWDAIEAQNGLPVVEGAPVKAVEPTFLITQEIIRCVWAAFNSLSVK
jgi:hypothetical protein